MSDTLGAYAFLPWLRQGMARSITAADGDVTVRRRATARVELTLTGQGLDGTALSQGFARDVELYGPGEIEKIEARAIVRSDPRPWITNFEPNYLAQLELYEEDFPWRYTPAAPDASRLRLRPWVTLVVLKQTGDFATSEFRHMRALAKDRLPFIEVRDYAAFPPAADLWAWAHVHVNRHLGASDIDLNAADVPAAVARLEAAIAANPDVAYSRLICPRRLEPQTAYEAFVVPTFERGRLLGLGSTVDLAPYASVSSWADYAGRPEPTFMPYFHNWYFRTGGVGDFESLVRQLKWKTVDPRVGHRDMDVQDPGSNIDAIDDAALGGILRLGGALRAPLDTLDATESKRYKTWNEWDNPYPHKFQVKLAKFVNLADQFTREPAPDARGTDFPPAAGDEDPLVTAPLYGEWQALQHRLLFDPDGAPLDPDRNWLHQLNLDPRHRVAAGFGGDVVRQNQEEYMEAAWAQVGEVLKHNQKARVARVLLQVSEATSARSVAAIADQPTRLLTLTAPVQARVVEEARTIRATRAASLVPPVLTSAALRRIARPGGPLARRLDLAGGPFATTMLEAVNDGRITAAPPKTTPAGLATVEAVAGLADAPAGPLADLLRRIPRLTLLLALLALLLLVLALVVPGLALLLLAAALAALVAAGVAWRAGRAATVAEALGADLDRPASIDRLGPGPDFVFGAEPSGTRPGPFATDNVAATRFKAALRDWAVFVTEAEAAGRETPRPRLDLPGTSAAVVEALRPARTIPARFLARAVLAPHIRAQIVEAFDEVRYYPRIDVPMYRPLEAMSEQRFVPNLDLIERETVVALETNQPFIEAYMVGVNHEFSRELLWREYPTDQRGTCFRQFWDVTSHFTPDAPDADALRQSLYDIPPIHTWARASGLGDHDNRQPGPGGARSEIVLAIRGELLKKYPTTIVYAHKAKWGRTNGAIDPAKERELVDLVGAEFDNPPRAKLLTPLYDARVQPDIYFFGFDLTADTARGGDGGDPAASDDTAGWFFVLKERPGEARFGFDETRDGAIVSVNDLAWPDTGTPPGSCLAPGALAAIALAPATGDNAEKAPQRADDVRVVGAPASAARWAYLLYQAPVMVAVHAAELLRKPVE